MPPHDHLFKSLFRAFFRDLLLLVGVKIAEWLAPDTAVEFRDKELIPDSPKGEGRIVDLLAAIPDPAGGTAVLVHVEIERSAPKDFGRRLWDYSIHLRSHHPEPLLSLVVFLRGGPPGPNWTVHTEEAGGDEVAQFRYLSLGLSKFPAEKLLARPEPLAWGLAALAKPGTLGRARVKFEALRRIENAPLSEREKLLLVNCVETYLPLKGREAEEYASLASAHDSPESEPMQMTRADKIEAKGIAKGRREGRKEGRKEGREEGMEKGAEFLRLTLLRQLDQRFGQVPEPLQERLAAIRSFAKLSAIAGRILEVQSIEELGLGG